MNEDKKRNLYNTYMAHLGRWIYQSLLLDHRTMNHVLFSIPSQKERKI